MAQSSPRLCRCGRIVRGACPSCSSGWKAGRRSRNWSGRGTDGRWRKLRRAFLNEHPLCQWPVVLASGRVIECGEVAERVDHIDGTDYATQRYEWDQLRALCIPHERERTTAQGNAAQGRGVEITVEHI